MAGRTAIRTLASLAYTLDDDLLVRLRTQAEQRCQERLASGVYVTHLAWLDWKSTANRLAEWVADHPDAPVYREHCDNPRFALDTSTRKAVARLLADRWQDKRGIRPQVRVVDTAEDTP